MKTENQKEHFTTAVLIIWAVAAIVYIFLT